MDDKRRKIVQIIDINNSEESTYRRGCTERSGNSWSENRILHLHFIHDWMDHYDDWADFLHVMFALFIVDEGYQSGHELVCQGVIMMSKHLELGTVTGGSRENEWPSCANPGRSAKQGL